MLVLIKNGCALIARTKTELLLCAVSSAFSNVKPTFWWRWHMAAQGFTLGDICDASGWKALNVSVSFEWTAETILEIMKCCWLSLMEIQCLCWGRLFLEITRRSSSEKSMECKNWWANEWSVCYETNQNHILSCSNHKSLRTARISVYEENKYHWR